MPRRTEDRKLHGFAVFSALATFLLIGIGGLVTSHGAGMAVPDWPNSYGYNMFLFPPAYWVGGIFYEHTHRLFASFVGLLTLILAAWLWLRESRRWLRWLGCVAVVTVVLQGVLGGLRVVLNEDQLGIVHATLAQLFFLQMTAIALFTSRRWRRWTESEQGRQTGISRGLSTLVGAVTVVIFLQLILGAAMRHQHAGLAVPDFPLAYGRVWPPTDPEFLEGVNRGRLDPREFNPITPFQVHLHMAHRATALAILCGVGACAWRLRRTELASLGWLWLALTVLQGGLGAATVWSNKAADVTTLHVFTGASVLALGSILAAFGAASRRATSGPALESIQGAAVEPHFDVERRLHPAP